MRILFSQQVILNITNKRTKLIKLALSIYRWKVFAKNIIENSGATILFYELESYTMSLLTGVNAELMYNFHL